MSQVIVRPFKEEDSGIVYASYPKAVFHGQGLTLEGEDKTRWFKQFYKLVQDQIKSATIDIACMDDEPDFVLGYSVLSDKILQFVYVKPLYRKQGIATLLTNGKYETINPDHITKLGIVFLTKEV